MYSSRSAWVGRIRFSLDTLNGLFQRLQNPVGEFLVGGLSRQNPVALDLIDGSFRRHQNIAAEMLDGNLGRQHMLQLVGFQGIVRPQRAMFGVLGGQLHLGQGVLGTGVLHFEHATERVCLGFLQFNQSPGGIDFRNPTLHLGRDGIPLGLFLGQHELGGICQHPAHHLGIDPGILVTGDPVVLEFPFQMGVDRLHHLVESPFPVHSGTGDLLDCQIGNVRIKRTVGVFFKFEFGVRKIRRIRDRDIIGQRGKQLFRQFTCITGIMGMGHVLPLRVLVSLVRTPKVFQG